MKNHVSLMLGLFFLNTFFSVAQNKDIVITSEKVAENIYMLKGQGGNIGIFIGEKDVFMIDDQFAPLTSKILNKIKEITNKPISYLVNTHWHGDHTGGNENIANEGALIFSHENVRKRMSVDQIIRGREKKASPKKALPVITFSKDMMFHIDDEAILISHVHNAHTDGDAHVYFTNSNVIHAGDTYFQGKFPFIDLESGGSIEGYINSIEKIILMSNSETKIIPGHGNIASKKELESYLKMLKDLKGKIERKITEGKSLKEIVKDISITKNYKKYSGWITEEKIKKTIYMSLKK